MSSNELLLSNSSMNCVQPRNNDILASISLSDNDLKVMLTESSSSDNFDGDEGSFIFVTRCDNGQIIFVSNTINNILNISQEEWLNTNVFTQIHPADQAKLKAQLIILNAEIDGVNDGNSENNVRKSDEVISVNCEEDEGAVSDISALAAGVKQDKNLVDKRAFSCRVKYRPKVMSTQHSTVVNTNEIDGSSADSRDNNMESTLAGQNDNTLKRITPSNNNYLTIQCKGLIRKWPLSLITKVNNEPSEQQQQQLNENEQQYVHCLITTATIKQQINTSSPVPVKPKLNQLNIQQFHQRQLQPSQLLPSSSSSTTTTTTSSTMTPTFNRIKQFTTRHTVNGNFIYVDQHITEALGYNTAELLDKCFFDYFYHDDCKFIKETFKFIPSLKGKPMTVTYRYWSKLVSYWVWLRIVIYSNSNTNRSINYIVCDCTVLPNEVTADNINNGQPISSSASSVTSSINRKSFNTNYSNRFNQHHHVQYHNNNNSNDKTVMQYNKDFMLPRHQYHKQQQQQLQQPLIDNLHNDQYTAHNIFTSNNGYLSNDQSSSMCQPFQLQTNPLQRNHHQQQQHQSRTMPSSSQLDMYNNMLQIDNYITGRGGGGGGRAVGGGGILSEEVNNLMAPSTVTQSNWCTPQISNTFPSVLTEWNVPSAVDLLPATSGITNAAAANWSFLFNNGLNSKANVNDWSSYGNNNSNTDLNSVEQQLELWATLDDVNATTPMWLPSDNNDALVYNQQFSNALLPANIDINSLKQKSNWMTDNVENFENISQFLYNENSINASSVNNLSRSNIYNELLPNSMICSNEQENQSSFYTELDIANIWSQMERDEQMQLQQFIINDNYGNANNNNNTFDDLGLNNLTMPAQSQTVAAIIAGGGGGIKKNVEDNHNYDLQQPWKLNEEMVNNLYNMTTRIANTTTTTTTAINDNKSTGGSTPSLTINAIHGHQQLDTGGGGNTVLLSQQHRISRSSPSSGNNNTNNILSRLPDLIEQVLHVDQTYNKHIITTPHTLTTPTETNKDIITNINNNTDNKSINKNITTVNTNSLITSTTSSSI